MNTRVDSHIPVNAKEEVSRELAARGPSISSFIRVTLSSVANDGPPKYWGILNAETISLINKAIDDLSKCRLKGASSYNEPEKLLDE